MSLSKDIRYEHWFHLTHDVDYALLSPHNVNLARPDIFAPPSQQKVTGSSGNDYFYATHTDVLGIPDKWQLTLDGGGGDDTIIAFLTDLIDPETPVLVAPHISNIDLFNVGSQQNLGAGSVGLSFANVTGMDTLSNQVIVHDLLASDIREQVVLDAYASSLSGNPFEVDYVVRYCKDVDFTETQELVLRMATIRRFSITTIDSESQAPGVAGLDTLEIHLEGKLNRIDSFTEAPGEDYNLFDTLQRIDLVAHNPAPNADVALALGEVWNGLIIDMAGLKPNGGGLDLRKADITGRAVTITASALENGTWGGKGDLGDGTPGDRQSEQEIALPDLAKLDGANVTISNLTVASTGGYTHIPQENDIISLTSWGVSGAAGLADLVTQIHITQGAAIDEAGAQHYVNWQISFKHDIGPVTDFTLTLENLMSTKLYNTMLAALDTVNADDDLNNTLDLIDKDVPIVAGTLHDAYKFNSDTEPPEGITISAEDGQGSEAIVGLIGILVNEGTVDVSNPAGV